MRPILAGLVIALVAGPAAAECVCTCVGNRSIPACSTPPLVKPICQQICVSKVDRSLGTGGGSGGGGGAAALAAGSGIDPSALRALVGR